MGREGTVTGECGLRSPSHTVLSWSFLPPSKAYRPGSPFLSCPGMCPGGSPAFLVRFPRGARGSWGGLGWGSGREEAESVGTEALHCPPRGPDLCLLVS